MNRRIPEGFSDKKLLREYRYKQIEVISQIALAVGVFTLAALTFISNYRELVLQVCAFMVFLVILVIIPLIKVDFDRIRKNLLE